MTIASTTSDREETVVRHLPLARKLARRYARSDDMLEELEQVAALGLVKAVDRFDPSRGTAFTSFAVPTILGELKRHFRDTRWALHVPRELQERSQRVARAVDRLTTEAGRSPTVAEVADRLGMPVEDVLEARAAFSGLETQSLDAAPPGGTGEDDAESLAELTGADEPGYELTDEWATLAPALRRMPERERVALCLRFAGDLTQREIGKRLGLSQMQISRILRRSITTLREEAA